MSDQACDPVSTRDALIGAFESVFEDASDHSLQDLSAAILSYTNKNPIAANRSKLMKALMDAAISELGYRQEMEIQTKGTMT
jgi:hypothetical protein